MPIQRLKNRCIENPRLLTCGEQSKTRPTASYWIVLPLVRSYWIFQSNTFQVIGLPHSNMISNKIPYRILWYQDLFKELDMSYWSIQNNRLVLINPKLLIIVFFLFRCCFLAIFLPFIIEILLLLYHIGMPIPYLKKSWIKNPKLITQVVRTIQHSAFGVVLDWLVQLSWIILDFATPDFLRYGIAPIPTWSSQLHVGIGQFLREVTQSLHWSNKQNIQKFRKLDT